MPVSSSCGTLTVLRDCRTLCRTIHSWCGNRSFLHAGHYLGGDVHDTASIGHDKPFQPGAVLAVEPALYIPNDAEKYRALAGIGIRLEDDVLVTEQGPVILSKDVPLEMSEIEDLVGTAADIAHRGI